MVLRGARSFALSLAVHLTLGAIVFLLARHALIVERGRRAPLRLAIELSTVVAEAPAHVAAPAPVPAPATAVGTPARPRRAGPRLLAPVAPSADAPAPAEGLASEAAPVFDPLAPVAAAPGAPGAAPVAPAAAPAPIDGESVRAAVQGTLRYPALARKRGLEGTVLVRFHIGSDGAVDQVTVVASAGRALDDAAQDAVQRAAPFRTGPGWVRIPVVFQLAAAP
jgi:TonB family protein